ncbi:hypothetical protein B0H14DRAFT_2556573 [Mycena olivaceomarginata]|nr:hypothetical protein B0H14DRAFT_2556573 [Mycena olivaceomarginata]
MSVCIERGSVNLNGIFDHLKFEPDDVFGHCQTVAYGTVDASNLGFNVFTNRGGPIVFWADLAAKCAQNNVIILGFPYTIGTKLRLPHQVRQNKGINGLQKIDREALGKAIAMRENGYRGLRLLWVKYESGVYLVPSPLMPQILTQMIATDDLAIWTHDYNRCGEPSDPAAARRSWLHSDGKDHQNESERQDKEANAQCCWFHYGNAHVKGDEARGLLAAKRADYRWKYAGGNAGSTYGWVL